MYDIICFPLKCLGLQIKEKYFNVVKTYIYIMNAIYSYIYLHVLYYLLISLN